MPWAEPAWSRSCREESMSEAGEGVKSCTQLGNVGPIWRASSSGDPGARGETSPKASAPNPLAAGMVPLVAGARGLGLTHPTVPWVGGRRGMHPACPRLWLEQGVPITCFAGTTHVSQQQSPARSRESFAAPGAIWLPEHGTPRWPAEPPAPVPALPAPALPGPVPGLQPALAAPAVGSGMPKAL